MWRRVIVCLAFILLAGLVCTPVASAQDPTPNYDKIVQIHLTYHDTVYSVSSMGVTYGEAPNLDILTGNLVGTVLDAKGNILKSFSFQSPGATYGVITGSSGDNTVLGYTQTSSSGEMTVTLPYQPGMQVFSLSDASSGTVLATTDLNAPLASFCTDYPKDPDCQALAASSPLASPAASASPAVDSSGLIYATLFSVAVFVAAGMAIRTIRYRLKKVVLIVDDEPGIVSLVDDFLRTKGYLTLTATSGAACLALLKKQVPHVILLDVSMAPMDGWQTLAAIKKDSSLKPVPVLMLTAESISPEKAKRYDICIEDYITKPFNLGNLAAAIDTVLRRRQKVIETFALAKKAGVEREKFCELASLTRRISVDRKLLDMMEVPHVPVAQASMETLDSMLIVDYISVKTKSNETRARQLREEINSALKDSGLPGLGW